MLATVPQDRIVSATGSDIDEHYAEPAMKLWRRTDLDYRLQDFNKANVDHAANE